MTALDPATHGLAFCNSVLLKPDGSQAVDLRLHSALDDDAADRLENVEARRRRQIILESISEWRRVGPGMLKQNPRWTWRAWTNAGLTQAGLDKLTAAEIKEYDP